MKVIDIHKLKDFEQHDAIFFTEEGIIVNQFTQSPFMSFSTFKKLEIDVKAVYLDGHTLIVSCQFSSCINHSGQFSIYPAKTFLTITPANTQERMLRAIHWLTWNEKSKYCSACGNVLQKLHDVMEKKCQSCDLSFFPNLSPAIMVLIQKDHQVLLARSAHFKPGIYSAIAGFIDIGESAEEAVHREVKEETGLEISQLEYFGTQSWPFPNSFMIAFKAQYLSGNLTIDPNELEDAQWFDIDNIPTLPSNPGISRRLIDSWRMRVLDYA